MEEKISLLFNYIDKKIMPNKESIEIEIAKLIVETLSL
jgi:hypothetical protein